jgi:hypothetical protein
MVTTAPVPLRRRYPRLAFFLAGFLISAASAAVAMFWYEVANGVLGMRVIHATRPPWLRAVMAAADWLPWVAALVVLAARLRLGARVRLLAYVAGALTPAALVLLFLFGTPVVEQARHARAFDPAAWRANAGRETDWPARLEMVDDLLRRHELRGLARDSVLRLLGPGDGDKGPSERSDLVYWLGPERGLIRIDSERLIISFGPDGRVSETRLVRD